MAAKTFRRAAPDNYFDLVKEFPLTRIRDDDHLGAAPKVIDRLLQIDLDDGARAYLEVLTDLVESYEAEKVQIPDASEADVLRELMQTNNLTQARLAKSARIAQSTLSAVLNGSRSLTKEQVIKLARFFNVSPAVIFAGLKAGEVSPTPLWKNQTCPVFPLEIVYYQAETIICHEVFMDLPIKFPPEKEKIYQEALIFNRLSPDERFQAILDVIALGAAMMDESPHKDAMLRLQRAHEEQWKKAQKELFARHGL